MDQGPVAGRQTFERDRVEDVEVGRDGDAIDQTVSIMEDLGLEEIHGVAHIARL